MKTTLPSPPLPSPPTPTVLGSNVAVKLRKTNQTDNEEKVCCAREGRDGRDGLPGPLGPQGLAGVLGERRKVEGGKEREREVGEGVEGRR